MRYPQALEYLNSFLNYEQVVAYRYREAFGLDRIEALLRKLGNPHQRYLSLHVAGTKGKGSTCAFTASTLQALGFKVGLYTSPHLTSLRERIRVNGHPIAPQRLAEIVEQVQPLASSDLTFFEVTTACAFLYFSQEKVDYAVIEVGLGGRLDATNVVTPQVCAITPISFDHMDKLGHSLSQIAQEKAGIIKPRVPVVVSAQPKEAQEVIEETVRAKGAPLHRLQDEVCLEGIEVSLKGSRFSFRTPQGFYPGLEIPLLGRHQILNAALSVRLAELSCEQRTESKLGEAVREGLRQAHWPGRCQLISGRPSILLDGAQNSASCASLVQTVSELFPNVRVVGVVGISLDKDISGIAKILGPWMDELILTRAQVPRAESPTRLTEAFSPWQGRPQITEGVPQALNLARQMARPDDLVVVTGSLFVVGEALEILGEITGGPSEVFASEKAGHPPLQTQPG